MTYLRSAFIVLAPLGLFAVGCDSKVPKEDLQSKPTASQSTPSTDQKTDPTAAKQDPDVGKDLPRASLPSSLMTDAYRYYGLTSSKPLDMTMKTSTNPELLTGSIAYRLVDVKDGVAHFTQDSTGALQSAVGSTKIELRKNGVYEVDSDKIPIKEPFLDLPSDITKGHKWHVETRLQPAGQEIPLKIDCESKGVSSLTIGGKSYQALYIVEMGTAGPSKISFKNWFIKDIGLVKSEVSTTGGGKTNTDLLQWDPSPKG